ncbi:hypothetical protein GE061_013087 [Apolygus lucorum]|uniref:Peptidase S1 domain-containing protein n=1 Tax=Apolygus lucorum TaxID=248454 RepID=A0A6A4JCA7_APOLU|nr:hypothetical protein GE061_013087 [Apolygus lucorum]
MIEFAGVLAIVSVVVEVTVAVHDDARKNLLERWKVDCLLDIQSQHPWMVKIWDIDYGQIVSHGYLVALHMAVTTCDGFIDAELRVRQFKIIGQNLPKSGTLKDACTQVIPASKRFVNLAAWLVREHFQTDGDFSPPEFPVDTSQFHEDLKKVESNAENSGCIVPFYSVKTQMNSTFIDDPSVTIIPYGSQCVDFICEDADDKEGCKKVNTTSKEHKEMCALPKWTLKVPVVVESPEPGVPYINWYKGAPFLCNDVLYGLLTNVIYRMEDRQDFFIISTYLNQTQWIAETAETFKDMKEEDDGSLPKNPDEGKKPVRKPKLEDEGSGGGSGDEEEEGAEGAKAREAAGTSIHHLHGYYHLPLRYLFTSVITVTSIMIVLK